jgi:DNA-binding GntR family transcriptional regulator
MSSDATRQVGRSQPQYAVLAQSLLSDIQSGRYPVSSLLPTEFELARQFGMSRHTVREAMRRLQDMGVIVRQQGVGTRVRAKSAATRYVQSSASIADLIQYAKDVRLVVRKEASVTADRALAELLRCKQGQRWLKLEGTRHTESGRRPVCHTDVFIRYEFSGIRDDIKRGQTPVYALIEKVTGQQVQEVEQEISAVAIPENMARMLRVKPGSPGLSITRHYVGAGGMVLEVAISTYPADRFSYSMRLRLDNQRTDR